ncbi:putative Sugar transporter [Quillaja saponaria]|uniref:Sugar transporter n=1 Tax=Quillaja saponaria TaxID=32244 RepID=A0AAD7PMK9_QUISA|nr:putative Sugar transporter [Quillaja saponaria]
MAGEEIGGASKKKQYPGNLTPRVIVTCMIAATGGLIFGYDHGVSGGVTSMDSFLKEFFPSVYEKESEIKPSSNQYCKFDSQILTLFTSSLYLAALISSVGAATITRMLGRRVTMFCGGILFVAGALLNGFAIKVWMLIVGRLLLGLGIGCTNQCVPIYLSEVAPYRFRGALNMMFQLSLTVGMFVANMLNYNFAKIKGGQGWRYSLGGAAVPAIMVIVGSLILPETPNSLIERGCKEEAKEKLIKIRGVPNVDEELNDLIAASEASKLVQHPWRSLLKRKYRPQLTMAICIPFFQQLTGLNVITFYAPVLFKTIGFGSNGSLMSAMIIGACKPVSTLVSILLVDKFGRRTLFLEGGAQMFICQIVITIAIALKFGVNGNPGEVPSWYASVVVVFICIYVCGFAWSWGPLGWLVPSEIFPLEIRSAAQSVTVCVNMIWTFVIAQFFTAMLCHMRFGLFIFFAFFVVVMSFFVYKFLPETKGIPIEEMSIVWQNHSYWSKFVKTEDDEGIEIYQGQGKGKGIP